MRTLVRAAGAVFVVALVALVAVVPAAGQGVTTSAMRGRVMDDQGSAVVGATMTLTLTTTGQAFTTQSQAGGVYHFENVPVGGPYRLQSRAIGYEAAQRTGIYLALGQALELNVTMRRSAVQLGNIEVTAQEADPIFSPSMTGSEYTVDDTTMRRQPSLDRSFTDFVHLTPQIADVDAGGISAVGQNNRFNTIQIDGSTVNDRFGLGSTGQTGGQANGRAVGLEAVQEYQVLLAPYDVRQGNFVGALINAVTKSGTNQYHGSVFEYFRNQSFAGDPLGLSDFSEHQFGASLGGPIVRDRAHFFLNAEFRRETSPARGPYLGQPASLGTPIASQAQIDQFNAAWTAYGLPGAGDGNLYNTKNPLANLLARVDWQVGSRSRLTFRYIYNTAQDDIFSRSSGGTFQLSNNSYHFKNKTNNPSLQFFTNFASGASNELLISWNSLRDRRNPDALAPLVNVENLTAADGSGTYTLRAGAEQFSQGNELDQDIFEFTDNFTFSAGEAHRITIGTRNEIYHVRNLFAQSSYGVWTFDGLTNFENGVASRYSVGGDIAGNGIAATFNAGILGAYVQDQWQVSPTLAVTAGLRVDAPQFFDQPTYDSRIVNDPAGFNTDVPGGLMFAPRVGFNLDLGEHTTQLRGGAGIFTGTPAYVWYSNAYSNNGTKLGQLTCSGANVPAFTPANFSVPNPTTNCTDGTGIAAGTTIGEVDIIGANTKFPQVLRGNLAVDHRLGGGLIGSIEFLYTKGINDFFIVNRNLNTPVGTDAHGRQMYGTISAGGFTNPSYYNQTLYGPSFSGGVYELDNTSNNRTWSLTGQLNKRFSSNWSAQVAYTYSDAKDVQSFTSSRAISNWRFGRTYTGLQTADNATTGSFNRPNRVVVSATWSAPWASASTDVTVSYVGQSGTPYTLIGGGSSGRGDFNADGTNSNDPIYIPNDAATEMQFQDISGGGATAAQQATAFQDYISGESCLNSQRGQIMARNSCQNPWQNFLNLNVRQTLPRIANGALTLELGIFNLLNLMKSDWGQVKTAGTSGVFNTDQALTVVGTNGTGDYIYQFDPSRLTNRFRSTTSAGNSYQVQVGLRYAF